MLVVSSEFLRISRVRSPKAAGQVPFVSLLRRTAVSSCVEIEARHSRRSRRRTGSSCRICCRTLERTIRLSCLHPTKYGDCVWSPIQEVAVRLPPLVHLASGSDPKRTTLRSTSVVRLDPRSSSQEPFRFDPAHVGRAS